MQTAIHATPAGNGLRLSAIFSLLLLSFTALGGGSLLIHDTSGGALQMPLSFLAHSPFHSYLIPGIILFSINGLLSLWAAVALIRKRPHSYLWVINQGAAVMIWIVVQVIVVRTFIWLQVFYLALGILLIALGIGLWRIRERQTRNEFRP